MARPGLFRRGRVTLPFLFLLVLTFLLLTACSSAPPLYGGTPAQYERQLGDIKQVVRLGVSPDLPKRVLRPIYGLELRRPEFTAQLFDAVTLNHYMRWQEADWENRKEISFDSFKAQLAGGQDLSYPVVDTEDGGKTAQVRNVNPARAMDIVFIPTHEGFVTIQADVRESGLSVKNTVRSDGSVVVRVPFLSRQLISYEKGTSDVDSLAATALAIALVEMSVPREIIVNNALGKMQPWWEAQPPGDLKHPDQYKLIRQLLTQGAGVPAGGILHVIEDASVTPTP